MTNNTINNLPRDWFDRVHALLYKIAHESTPEGLEAECLGSFIPDILSASSPADADGLEVVGWYRMDDRKAITPYPSVCATWHKMGAKVGAAYSDSAHAIIDGLRGEVADLRSMLATVSKAGLRVRTERDHHARRISELETALEFACKSLAQVTSSDGSGHADIAVSVLRMAGTKDADALHVVEAYTAGAKWRIDATLSAGKEGE